MKQSSEQDGDEDKEEGDIYMGGMMTIMIMIMMMITIKKMIVMLKMMMMVMVKRYIWLPPGGLLQ